MVAVGPHGERRSATAPPNHTHKPGFPTLRFPEFPKLISLKHELAPTIRKLITSELSKRGQTSGEMDADTVRAAQS